MASSEIVPDSEKKCWDQGVQRENLALCVNLNLKQQ